MGGGAVQGELITDERGPRRSERVRTSLSGGFRERGAQGGTVEVLDLSPEGFRCRWHWTLQPDQAVWLRLPGLEALPARVVWSDDFMVGAAFDQPLHPAIFERITARG
ncbi:PilZ domain-containing protein [Sphingomonas laterariae]|uniref:PilZ domain-containing protein n=1 Tax=Edaphosphingomonas laterariae TaxID=861865 RepID=A0A239HJ57_9SPHN|nr:PilZ domain-containing protein [Sphingomonas laterariae]SNS81352.1 PilZ domain-containing protein [Sphingomonas laterariae]